MMITEPTANLSCLRFMYLPLQVIRDIITLIPVMCSVRGRPFPTILAKSMKRYPMFDPPEYVAWQPEPSILEEYEETLEKNRERSEIISELSQEQLLELYAGMLRFRLHDITLRRWVRQGIL